MTPVSICPVCDEWLFEGISHGHEEVEHNPRNYPEPDANSAVDKKLRREDLRCSFCPPNRAENRKRQPKHGVKKPRRGKS